MLGFAELLGNQHMGETGLRLMYDFALVPRSALIPDLAHTATVYQTARFQLVPPASSPCRTLDDAKKLQFQMNVFWLKAARIVPKGGPRRDTRIRL